MRVIYLHGFASAPGSTKGRALAAAFARRGVSFEQPDLNAPTFETLSLSAMCQVVRARITADDSPCVIAGSSLGGYVAALVASGFGGDVDARVRGLVLLAPAFELAPRWRERVGPSGMATWRREGSARYPHHSRGTELPLSIAFLDEADGFPTQPTVRLPVTVIQGRRDETVPHVIARAWVDRNPQVTLVEVDDDHQLLVSLPRIELELAAMIERVSV